jgi:hypothetical protein
METKQDPTLNQIQEAIDHVDRPLASDLLRKIQKGELRDPVALDSVTSLQIVNFPNLSDQDAFQIITSHVLDFFRLEISFEQSILARYAFQGEDTKNIQRANIKKAILGNNAERLGNLTIGEWLLKFDNAYKVGERDDRSILEFILNEPEARNLNAVQRNALKEIIHTYDELIAEEVVDVFDLTDAVRRIQQHGIPEKSLLPKSPYVEPGHSMGAPATPRPATPEYSPTISAPTPTIPERPTQEAPKEITITPMPLKVAIEKYPGVGEQTISSSPINVSSSPNPLRPTVKNWIRDYYDIIGTGKHSLLERSKYLYSSPNAKMLSESDRQKLLEVIRSIEENANLTIDATNQKIVFEARPEAPEPTPAPQKPTQTPQEASLSQKLASREKTPSQNVSPAPRATTSETDKKSAVSRSQFNNMELGSTFHDAANLENVSDMRFDAPHTLPNEDQR